MISQIQAINLFASIAGAKKPNIKLMAGKDDVGAILLNSSLCLAITTDYTNFTPLSTVFNKGTLYDRGFLLVLHNASDLLGSGVKPLGFLASLGLPPEFKRRDIIELAKGIKDGTKFCNISLVGGDTKSAPVLALCGTAFGVVHPKKLWKRCTGVEDEDLFLSGPVGGVSAAVYALSKHKNFAKVCRDEVNDVLLKPQLPLKLFKKLRKLDAKISAIDISDGLGADLHSLLSASSIGAELDASEIPVHNFALKLSKMTGIVPSEFAFGLGGDGQFIFAISRKYSKIVKSFGAHRIGRLTKKKEKVIFFEEQKITIPKFGHKDFELKSSAEQLLEIVGTRFHKN